MAYRGRALTDEALRATARLLRAMQDVEERRESRRLQTELL
eukprot:SAG25_NODE_1291_length_3388_cov_6.318334_1_plen_40_part_10